MCLAIYIGADHPLETTDWKKDLRQVYLTPLAEKDEPVRQWFSKPHIYYAGSHLQCGCGFFHYGLVLKGDPSTMLVYEETQRSTGALVVILEHVLASSDTVEVFVTWEGRQAEPPGRKRLMVPKDLLAPLQRCGEDNDEEIRCAVCPVEEQDFIVMQLKR